MKRIDIGGALRHHMWEHSTAFPLVELTQLAPVRQAPYATYAQSVSMPMQASTYLLDWVRNGRPPALGTPAEIRAAIRVGLAIVKSADTGQIVNL